MKNSTFRARSARFDVGDALLALIFLGLSACGGGGGKSSDGPQGRLAPAFSVSDLSGKTVNLKDQAGKVVFLDFWATWCPPCVESVPEVEKMYQEYKDKGVVFLGMNLDDDAGDVARFVKEGRIDYPILLAASSPVSELYRVSSIPMFVLIDQDQKIRRRWVGYGPSAPDEWRRAIDELLKK